MTTLAASYARCRTLNKRYGTTYYWSTYLLPRIKRHHVHALYAFCRLADDVVDTPAPGSDPARELDKLRSQFFEAIQRGESEHPVLKAVVHTVRAFAIDPECFDRFLSSMEMDLSITSYPSYDALLRYMDGSAAVIGEMMLPILEPSEPARARAHARDLGLAFQFTNFLRDVGEDLDRGRVYVPADEIARFGAGVALDERRVTPEWRDLMQFEIARARALYESADIGIGLLPPASARCVGAARRLYSQILERIESASFDVFSRRARVPSYQKVATTARTLVASGMFPS